MAPKNVHVRESAMGINSQRIGILANLDGFANSRKPFAIESTLTERGHDVTIVDTRYMSRVSTRGVLRVLPSPEPRKLLLYIAGAAFRTLERLPCRIAAPFNYYLYLLQMHLRGQLNIRKARDFDVVICEMQIDSAVMLKDLAGARKIYDCATPFADELYYGGKLTERGYRKFKSFEMNVFEACDHLSFHWHSYASYVKKYYGDVSSVFTFDFMTEPKGQRVHFNSEPRIAYIGSLGGYWIDLQLLSELTKIYPHIDVYGLPKPPKRYGLNYKGYATLEVLHSYQFGLITSSKDQLRREGFSAKHLDYLAIGLPVLVPEWRESASELRGTITYNVDNFMEQLKTYSNEDAWNKMSKEALEQSEQYSAENVMKDLIRIVESNNF